MNHSATILLRLNIIAACLSVTFYLLRLWSRLKVVCSPGWDDAIAGVALIILCVHSGLDIRQISYGTGKSMEVLPPQEIGEFMSGLETELLVFFVGTYLTRLSICFFLPRLKNTATFKKLVWGVSILLTIVSFFCFFFVLFQCKPVSGLWNRHAPGVKCLDLKIQTIILSVHACFGICFDIFLLGTPVWIILRNMLSKDTALKVAVVFLVAALSIIANIVRLVYMVNFNPNDNVTLTSFPRAFWSDMEIHTGFWAACLPAIQPLLRVAASKIGVITAAATERSASGKVYEISGNSSRKMSRKGAKTLSDGSQEEIITGTDHAMGDYGILKTMEIKQGEPTHVEDTSSYLQEKSWAKV